MTAARDPSPERHIIEWMVAHDYIPKENGTIEAYLVAIEHQAMRRMILQQKVGSAFKVITTWMEGNGYDLEEHVTVSGLLISLERQAMERALLPKEVKLVAGLTDEQEAGYAKDDER